MADLYRYRLPAAGAAVPCDVGRRQAARNTGVEMSIQQPGGQRLSDPCRRAVQLAEWART